MFTQLDPALPLYVLGKGDGHAIGVIDYGQEHNRIWVTVLNESGEVWCAPNPEVRFRKNWTMGRKENPLVAAEKARTGGAALCMECAAAVESVPVV